MSSTLGSSSSSSSSSSSTAKHSTTFWDSLKQQTGENTLGRLLFAVELIDAAQGAMQCCADPYDGGFRIVKCECAKSKKVYYLPYLRLGITRATRADYETGSGSCAFFLTCPLTGCRFVLTPTEVLHIANNAGADFIQSIETPIQESMRRTRMENGAIGHSVVRRRVSVSEMSAQDHGVDGSYGAKNTGIQVGCDMGDGTWKYKYLIQPPTGSGEMKESESSSSSSGGSSSSSSSGGTKGTWCPLINP
jgi:hypothetical protein